MSVSATPTRILVVEDEPVVARDLQTLLRQLGYTPVGHAREGAQGVMLAGELQPDLVLMDVQLAGDMDGITAAQAIREQFALPVVFITAFAEDATVARAKVAEPFGYILKPFSERELNTAIQMALYKFQADFRLKASEARLRLVIAASRDGVWDRDLIKQEVFYSDRWWKILGYAPNELPASASLFHDLTHPDDRERAETFVAQMQAGVETHYEFEVRLRHQAGHYVPILSRGIIVRDPSGRAIRVAGTNTDLTSRKAAEATLREREQHLRTIIETEPECVKVVGRNGELLEMNASGLAMLEAHSVAEVLEHGLAACIRPEHRDAFIDLHQRVMRGESSRLEFEITGLRGTRRWLETSAAPMRNDAGQVTMLLGITRDITTQRLARENLRRSDVALKAISQGVLIAGVDQRILSANAAFSAITGYAPQEILGQSYRFLHGPDTAPHTIDAMRRALEAGVEFAGDILNYRKDGSPFWNELTLSPVHGEANEVTGLVGVTRDITARKRAEAELKHRTDFQAHVAQIIRDLLSHRELGPLLLSSVQLAADNFAVTHATILLREGDVLVARATWTREGGALATAAVLPPDEGEPAWAVLKSGRPLRTKVRADATATASTTGVPVGAARLDVPISHGPAHLGVLSLVGPAAGFAESDLAEAAQLAEALALVLQHTQMVADLREDVRQRERAEKKIAESQARLAGIIDSAMDAIITVNTQQQVVLFNPAAEAIFRLSQAEALGQPLDRFIPARFRSGHRQHLENFSADGTTSRAMGRLSTVRGLRADGEEFAVEASISQVKVGGETLFTVILRDVSARERIEQEKTAVEAQLRQSQKLDAIGQLSGGIAHDFNNLLTAILGNASLLQDEGQSPLLRKELLQQITQAGNRAASLTRQLLLFSRREEPGQHDLDLNHVVAELFKMLRRLLGENIDLQLALAAEPQCVHADAGMLDQILLNLAVNARDAMPQGGKLTITTAALSFRTDAPGGELTEWRGGERRSQTNRRDHPLGVAHPAKLARPREGDFTCLSVRDEGCGMTPEVLAHMFEPFFTTKAPGQGTGLGLATVYGAVRLHEGWIEVDSLPGVGTTFRVYLPMIPPVSLATTAAPSPHLEKSGRGETILIVEDETTVRKMLRLLLERAGYRVLDSASGAAALALWPHHRTEVKLVITDMIMPDGVSGLDLVKQLVADRPDLRAIVISGYGAALQRDRQAPGLALDFIAKPFALKTVLDTIRTSLDAKPRA